MLVASTISSTHVALSWTDNAMTEWGFGVERAISGSGSWIAIGNTPPDVTAFQDTTVACGTDFEYRVSAFNCAGSSAATLASGSSASCFPPPASYCTAKPNSLSCVPEIGWSGTPTTSGLTDDFFVTASNVINRKSGIMIWSTQPAVIPFGGGTLCVAPPIIRTPGQNSGGNPAPPLDCSGQYSFHFGHGYIQTYFLAAGQTLRAQYWSRDPGFASPNDIGLTDGLTFTLLP